LLGAIVHFTKLTSPREVVFDETHMGKFVSAYCCTGERIFDVHPPHAKLLIALGSKVGGYDGKFPFDRIGQPYSENTPVFFLRLVPALSGLLLPIIFFSLLIQLGATVPAALLGGIALVFENAITVETRILVFDGILLCAQMATLYFLLPANRAKGFRFYWLTFYAGACAGLALGTKFTGLAALGVSGVYLVVKAIKRWDRAYTMLRFRQALVLGLGAALVYVAGWAIHFALLTRPGPADAFHPTTGNFWHDFQVVHKTMHAANSGLQKTHPDGSGPFTWPLMKVAPFYWAGKDATIYLIGNPIVWWGTSLLFLVLLVNLVLRRVTTLTWQESESRSLAWLIGVGYVISFAPLIFVKRVLFLYHYLTPLVFSLAFVILWLDRSGFVVSSRLHKQRRSYYVVVGLIVAGFLVISPITYGFSLGTYDEWLVGIIRSWR
jgi:dolichyl-phosphate-mannose--protein O-mannosyl transferase